jgi:hypothetical protein
MDGDVPAGDMLEWYGHSDKQDQRCRFEDRQDPEPS